MTLKPSLFWWALAAGWLVSASPIAAAAEADDELFGSNRVLQLKLDIPQPQLDALRKDAKVYVKGTIREGEKAFNNVGVRLKGATAVQLLEKKPCFTLKFDEFEKGQYFHGHGRVVLDNALHDPSYLNQALGSEIFRAAGVPAARVTFARVELNGRDLGLYVLAQPATRDFLSDHFKKTKGNFYEGDKSDVTSKLRLDSGKGKGPEEQPDLRKLVEAARDGDAGQRMRKLTAVLDVDRFLSFLAAEIFASHRKGYAFEHNQYRIYHDPASDRLVFLPESLEDHFGKANGPLVPECKGLVARGLLTAPEGQRLYRERMAKLLTTAFKVETLQARINDLAGRIRPVVARDPNDARAFDAAVARLREIVAQRAKFMDEELKKPAK